MLVYWTVYDQKMGGGVTFAVQINFLFLHVFAASSFELPTELPEISQEKKPS